MLPGEVGNVSVKAAPLMVVLLGLVSVNVRVETPPTLIGLGEKLFAIVIVLGSMIFAIRDWVAKSLL